MTVLVLGLGNTVLSDDGVGVYVSRCVREQLAPDEPIRVAEAEVAGFALLDLLEGHEACVIVDASLDADLAPGELRRLDLREFAPTARLAAGHQIDLPTALALGQTLGRNMPRQVVVLAVGVADARTLGEACTPAVEAALPAAVDRACALARELARSLG